MATATKKMAPKVNLLDCDKEPTDAQLAKTRRDECLVRKESLAFESVLSAPDN